MNVSTYNRRAASSMPGILRVWFGLALLLIAIVLPAERGFGQTLAGLTGSVTDSTGAAIPGAQIIVRNAATGIQQTVVTSGNGSYTLPSLLPGVYSVTVSKEGFGSSKQEGLLVDVGSLTTYSPSLSTGNATTVVDVTSSAVEINADSPTDATVIESRSVEDLPISTGSAATGAQPRQIDSFLFLAAGATGNNFSHRINGGVNFQNEVLFNGIALTQAEAQGYQTEINPPYESVGEFKVLRSSFSAQYGLGQGAANYQFKSGTNRLHGNAYEFLRNDALDAHPASSPTGNTPIPVNVNKQNDFGFVVGGPVVLPHVYDGRNRFFWNVTGAWYEFRGSGDNALRSVPTAREKTGDFSQLPVLIYDPTTGSPFPGNIIPAGRISPLSSKIAALFPDPDMDTATAPNILPQIRSSPTSNQSFAYTLDYNITQNQSLHWTQWRNGYKHIQVNAGAESFLNNPLGFYLNEPTTANGGFLSYNNTLRPNLIVQAGLGMLSDVNPQTPVYHSTFGVPGLDPANLPAFNFGGLYPLTSTGNNGVTSNLNRKVGITINNNWTWLKGKNTFNIGGEVRLPKQNDNECGNCAGHFSFSNFQTSSPTAGSEGGDIAKGGNAFASFLLGLPDSINQSFVTPTKLRSHSISFYVQDDLKLSPKLTVNLGLRYDLLTPFHEVVNKIPFFTATSPNPGAGNLPGVLTKLGTCEGCAGYDRADIFTKAFSPRIGFAYKVDENTVIRAGFALLTLNGGAFEFGSGRVATTYPNILAGQSNFGSTGGVTSSYGEWDKTFPAQLATPFSPTLGLGQVVTAFSPKAGRPPYQEDWNVAVQRQLHYGLLATMTYSGNRTLHLGAQLNPINQGRPSDLQYGSLLTQPYNSPAAVAAGIKEPFPGFGALLGGNATVAQALLPFPQYQSVGNNYDLNGTASYNALETELQKRFSSGFSLLTSYVWSKSMNNIPGSYGFSIFDGGSANKYDQRAEWAISDADVRHNYKASGLYELPVGRGKRFLNKGGVVNQVVGGWQVGAVLNYSGGTPVGINLASGTQVGALGFASRPIRISGVRATYSDQSHRIYSHLPILNAAAFATPSAFQLTSSKPRYGDIRSPGFANEDLNITKHFPIFDRATVEFRADYFNALNRVIFNGPDTGVGGANYGLVFGNNGVPRTGQLSLKVTF